ncbi:hypothetical protein ACIQU6_07480 [Streptomyces sp. NPDC090442]|uniref:hypothetical protein n=1 Tax=Streptomyces sp. NPDC090442 TaxID=3365962 RepID=UPI0038067ACF
MNEAALKHLKTVDDLLIKLQQDVPGIGWTADAFEARVSLAYLYGRLGLMHPQVGERGGR